MTLDSTYLRARLARVIQEHTRLHRLASLSFSIDLVEIVLHELARERGKHDRREIFPCILPLPGNCIEDHAIKRSGTWKPPQ
jgi:hypothetical protein